MSKRIARRKEEWTMSFHNRLDIYDGRKKVAMYSNERVVYLPVVKLVAGWRSEQCLSIIGWTSMMEERK